MSRFSLDLNNYRDVLGNPDDYFVDHAGRAQPLIVRHSDGVPAYVVEDDDTLTPWESPAPNPEAAPVVGALDPQAGGATFSGG
jgi:hypothetical protein